MTDQMKLFLFGDQTFDIQPHLRYLMQARSNPVVEDFLSKAYKSIRQEIYQLPREVRDDLPRFTCLDDLLLRKPGGKRCIPLDMAVTVMYQLGIFISRNDPWQYSAGNARVLGLCTGALSAAAVSCSRSMSELVSSSLDAIVVAFRTGICVTDIAQRIEPSSTPDQTWSIIVGGLASTNAVDKFCDETMLPPTSQPYVSAYAPNGVTVSGPPCSLARLTGSGGLKGFRSIPIHGPYHAPHLFSSEDVQDIVESLPSSGVSARSSRIPIISGTGTTTSTGDFITLLKHAVDHILLLPIRWGSILEEIQICLSRKETERFSIVPIGTTADQLIYTALKQTSLRTLVPSPSPEVTTSDEAASQSSPSTPKLAIIAMSGRFPGAKDNEAFWDLLHQGLDVHKPAPALHWDVKTHVDPTGARKNTSATPYGCWLDDPAAFDARFFNISPREAPQIDPAQRLALMTAYEAIEQAGLVPDATPSTRRDRVGVFYGVTSNDWMETNSAQNIDTYFIPGGNRAFIPGRVNYFFKFSGPSFAVDTACSSSLAGIHLACNALWRMDIDTAIAGGTNVLTNPDFTAGLDRGHFLSRTGNCKTFDDSADGYCRGEGIGTVIIKRLDDAIADNDPIQAVILGAYTNHSAESESITRPHVGAQRAVFGKILNQGSVDPYSVSYVEMHGTGTQAGDAGEMSSVLDTFAPPLGQVQKARSSDQALYLGSAKANIGHGEAASGVTSLIKVLLMMQKNTIVPHCGIKTKINHKFPTDLAERNVNIALKPTRWERSSDPSKPRRVFVNNFSAAGGNSALLIEDAPLKQEISSEPTDPRTHHFVTISAKNGISLQGNLRSMLGFLKQNPQVSLGKLSYTTTARRIHHQHRVALIGTSVGEVCAQIEAAVRDQTGMTRPKGSPKVVFTFTGQGAQYPGMGKQLFENFSVFRTEMRRLDQIGQSLGFPSILPIIQSEEQDIGIFAPTAVQLSSVCMQIALSRLWASWRIDPIAVIGHSLGEYAALNVAGVLSDADTIYLVGKRAELLQRNCTKDSHAMLVAKASVDEIAGALKGNNYETACINSPTETVLAGPNEKISVLKGLLMNRGVKSTLLKVPYAFHSSQIDPVLAEFKDLASGVTYSEAKIPIVCPLDGSIVKGQGSFGPEYLGRHSREPVNMFKALQTAYDNRIITDQTTTLEIGPHPAISGMVRGVLGPQVTSLASLQRGRSVWQTLAATIKSLYTGGADIDWAKYHCDFGSSHEVLQLPAYSWDLKDFWIQYVNDWSLRKGDPPLMISNAPTLQSTTVHRVVEELHEPDKTRLVVEADITRKDLSPLVQGHEVDGVPLCTPSIYADIALTLGTYLLKRYRPDQEENLVDITDMIISKALILRDGADEQLLQAHAEVDWQLGATNVKFMTFDNRQKLQEHSRCTLRFRDRSLLKTLQDNAAEVKEKMRVLRSGIAMGVTARYNRAMAYRAIRPLARFHDDYRGLDEVVLNSKTLEASTHLSFGSVKRDGIYHTHPALIDSLTQACGFTMNCNDATDLDTDVFMNHGWGSFQLFEPLDFDKEYDTYTCMVEGADKLWYGDIVIFDGDKVVAFFGQVAIQGVPRRVFRVVLSIESGKKSATQQPAQKSAQKPQSASTAPSLDHAVAQASVTSIRQNQSSKINQALSIIADESGIAVADLTDNTIFGDVGIDSLLGLTISARFREELDMDLDFNALFYEYPTVGDLKSFLGDNSSSSASEASPSSTYATTTPRSGGTGITTPATDAGSIPLKVDFQRALQIISEESGVAADELTDDTNFADAGVDSLLGLVIVSRFRDELELDIQHESLFLECPTVADLKQLILGDSQSAAPAQPLTDSEPLLIPALEMSDQVAESSSKVRRSDVQLAALTTRKEAVDEYVRKYTAGFTGPDSSSSSRPSSSAKVVLVTGASGSLGGQLVDQIAHLPDVKTVICLNRSNNAEPYARQLKTMRDRGIRFPEALKSKLVVYQTESSRPYLGLSSDEYEGLVHSVTHLIHNAWPMSAKRPLPGFESQFQTMRNLIDFANEIVSRRPESFKFGFQMVSSIGVVGQYDFGSTTKIVVPEERVGIDSVLPNGYGEAKWGCERMLDETLHKFPERFRTMVVRLGQIAGSSDHGYWNPMEHFGFLVKSSQTLNVLPNMTGGLYWTPVNEIAGSLADLVLADNKPYPVYHIENPVGQSWEEMTSVLAKALHIPTSNIIPFRDWMDRVRDAPQRNNPASTLLDFLEDNFLRMSCGGLVLDMKKTLEHSKTLRGVGPVSEIVAGKYVHIWKEIGFLNSTEEDKARFAEERARLWGHGKA